MTILAERLIKSVRKPRSCDGCCHIIARGDAAIYWVGLTDGEFGTLTYHPDCRVAEIALNHLKDSYYDEWSSIADIEWDDWPWLIESHPTVAARRNITMARFAEIQAEQERCRAAFRAT